MGFMDNKIMDTQSSHFHWETNPEPVSMFLGLSLLNDVRLYVKMTLQSNFHNCM